MKKPVLSFLLLVNVLCHALLVYLAIDSLFSKVRNELGGGFLGFFAIVGLISFNVIFVILAYFLFFKEKTKKALLKSFASNLLINAIFMSKVAYDIFKYSSGNF